jgi:cobalamin biosynthesis protein CobD/CbiB
MLVSKNYFQRRLLELWGFLLCLVFVFCAFGLTWGLFAATFSTLISWRSLLVFARLLSLLSGLF